VHVQTFWHCGSFIYAEVFSGRVGHCVEAFTYVEFNFSCNVLEDFFIYFSICIDLLVALICCLMVAVASVRHEYITEYDITEMVFAYSEL
jgi:hypothetical protein